MPGLPVERRKIAGEGLASSCYFRTTTRSPARKALIQITERCNLHCAHCFVSATKAGDDLSLAALRGRVLPQMKKARVTRVTLTGGEPFTHPDIVEIVSACREHGMTVTVCTNGTLITELMMSTFADMGGVRMNVSLDGFSSEGHGRFRGSPQSFQETIATVRALARHRLLKGILATPNTLAEPAEYEELCVFARECGAEYVLMNPLAPMGRGVRGQRKLAASEEWMRSIGERTAAMGGADLDVVQIRFPNDAKPLSACEAGTIVYVFVTGEVTVCPYLVFAARTPGSQHSPGEFIVGNVLEHDDVAERLDAYRLHDRSREPPDLLCNTCTLADRCGRGCPAAVIASGGRLGDRDVDQCPQPLPDAA